MSYVTGVANTLEDLLTAIRSACTDHGWTLTGNVLHRGDAYVRTQISAGFITYLGGTGLDGTTLLGAGPQVSRNGNFGVQAMTFPCAYEVFIHTSPDEVCVVLNYAVDYYQYAAWGLSDVAGLPGTGMWYAASRYAGGGGSSDGFSMPTVNGGVTNGDTSRGSPAFYATTGNLNAQTSYIHHGLDGGAWSGHGALNDRAQGFSAIVPLLGLLPNTWNGETVLLPFPIYIARSSGNKMSLVGNLKHLRHCRINFHNPGDIITLGSDQWKVYPWYRKNVSTPGSSGVSDSHSGTVGFAVRYTGA